MKFNIISLMPDLLRQGLEHGVVGKAFKNEICQLSLINPRAFTSDVHQTVDDRPFGGGDGMLMMAEPLQQSLDSVAEKGKVFYLSPQGEVLNDKTVKSLAREESLTLICGRYGGVDQRFLNSNSIEEISVGDYVLSGGELPALVLIDAVVRQIPGVLGHSASAHDDSFKNDLLEPPYFTRPQEWRGQTVPSVLLSGDHKKISFFKEQLSWLVTLAKRPDLLEKHEVPWQDLKAFADSLSAAEIEALGLEINELSLEEKCRKN